jgi:hypothetical protein
MTDPLGIYLQDHLAGATFGLELVERAQRNNEGTEFDDSLGTLAEEIRRDREALLDVMRDIGARPSRLKVAAAWASEKARRVKPNGRLVGYTPLARIEEFESLAIGIAGKRALWHLLERLQALGRSVGSHDYAALADRAQAQLELVEELRVRAGEVAFGVASPART